MQGRTCYSRATGQQGRREGEQARIQDSEGGVSYIQKGGFRTGISGADPNCSRALGKSTSKKKLQTAVGGVSDHPKKTLYPRMGRRDLHGLTHLGEETRIMVAMYRRHNAPVGMYPFPGRNVPLPRLVSPRLVSGNPLLARESFHTWPAGH